MIGREFKFHNGGRGAALALRVKSGRNTSRFEKVLKDGTVVVHLTGASGDTDGELLELLARELQVAKSRLQVIAGEEDKNKLVSVLDMFPEEIQKKILDRIG